MENFYYKIHQVGADVILAVADKSALGKKYEGNGRVLDLVSFANFYQGELANSDKIKELFDNCTCANLVGANVCKLAIEHNLANSKYIVDIGGVSHIQLYKFAEGNE